MGVRIFVMRLLIIGFCKAFSNYCFNEFKVFSFNVLKKYCRNRQFLPVRIQVLFQQFLNMQVLLDVLFHLLELIWKERKV